MTDDGGGFDDGFGLGGEEDFSELEENAQPMDDSMTGIKLVWPGTN